MSRTNLVERRFAAYQRKPLSVTSAMAVIVVATLVSVVVGGVLMTLVDPENFPDLGTGLWWALQTATTVGYGDVTPSTGVGRMVAGVFMLEAIAFVAIITAGITSNFVARARREHTAATAIQQAENLEAVQAQLKAVSAQLERIERSLGLPSQPSRPDQVDQPE